MIAAREGSPPANRDPSGASVNTTWTNSTGAPVASQWMRVISAAIRGRSSCATWPSCTMHS